MLVGACAADQSSYLCGIKRNAAAFSFFSGSWWDLPQVPDDLWRLCQEENTQRKGKSETNVQKRL